jgi:hypothetical protein
VVANITAAGNIVYNALDALGSTAETVNGGNGQVTQMRYYPYGEVQNSVTTVTITASPSEIQATVSTQAARLPVGSALQGGLKFVANVVNAKTIFDAGIAVGAAAVCAVPGIR